VKSLAAALGALLVLTACARPVTTLSASGNASLAPPATAAARPHASATHAVPPSAPTTAAAVPAPVDARPARHAVAAAKPAPIMPQILGASVSPAVVGSGSVVSATVTTTPGVVSVTAFAGGTSMPVPRVGPGLFRGSTTLPPLPPFAHGSYAVTFVARDARGLSTQSAVGVTVR
jgi:hypothetical protein